MAGRLDECGGGAAPEAQAVPPTPANAVATASVKGEGFRTDIQALRGLAVTLVVLYHAGLSAVQGGYLGVDIFFTISGFLITGIVVRGLENNRFRFQDFYTRRARRLLPAAAVTLLGSTLLAAWLLTATRYDEYLVQLLGASVFAANITAWLQTGYFSTDAAFNPLLHMWSLAIEEQYYLLMPFVLWALPPRWRLPAIAVATVGSLVLCLYLVGRKPSVTFYMLPTRAWELGIGSLGALVATDPRVRRIASVTLPVSIGLLIAVPLLPLFGPHPGINAVVVCLATLGVLLAGSAGLSASAPVRGLAMVGDFSYSLYLVHWPLLAMARVVYITPELPASVATGLVALSFILAFLMFRTIEEPIRHARLQGWKLAGACIGAFAALLALAYMLAPARADAERSAVLLAPVEGLPPEICTRGATYEGTCRQPGNPQVLLWGDSYSQHLVPGLLATMDGPLEQASYGHCSPLLDYAEVAGENERLFAESCMVHSASVIDYIRRTPRIRTVIISGQYGRTLSPEGMAIARVDGRVEDARKGMAPTLAAQRRTVAAVRALGRRVVIVSPTPPNRVDLGQCWERTSQDRLIVGPHRDCRLRRSDDPAAWREHDAMMDGFERVAGVPVIRLDRALCDDNGCATQWRGLPLFKDTGHLTETGSIYVGRRLDLGRLAERVAR